MDKTPLEIARQREDKIQYCDQCPDVVEIEGIYYCGQNGKIILPMFLERGQDNGPSMGCNRMAWKRGGEKK